ncbi:MAG: hypothetical protein ACUVV0_01205 [Anaerolineae bacterium]
METMIVEREQALWLVAKLLAEYEPNVKVEVLRTDSTIIIRPQKALSELLQWAERIGDKYDDVFRRLAES